MQGKKSFLLYCDMIHSFEQLTDSEAGQLVKHIFKYVNDQDPILEDRLLQVAFEPIKHQLKRDLLIWKEEVERDRKNGKKGAKKRWGDKKQYTPLIANHTPPIISIAKIADNDTVNDNDIDNVKIQVEKFKKENPNKYNEELYSKFITYWSEPFLKGKNKGKEKWTGQETWSLAGRLANWYSRSVGQETQTSRPVKLVESKAER